MPAGNLKAAFMIISDDVKDREKIREMGKSGYMVRTRADSAGATLRQLVSLVPRLLPQIIIRKVLTLNLIM